MNAIADDGTAERSAKLMAFVLRFVGARAVNLRLLEPIEPAQVLVAEELVRLTRKLVRAAARDDADDTARAAAVLGGRLTGEYLELADRRLRKVLARLPGLGRHVHRAVDQVVRRELQRA